MSANEMRRGPSFERARELCLRIVAMPSVDGSEGERSFPESLRELLLEWPYFRERPDQLRLEPLPGDAAGRSCLVALARGSGDRAVVLSGHYDVVEISAYGPLAGSAFDPEALTPLLVEELRAAKTDELALSDLESGDFLAGRGVLDMKSGLAAGLAALEDFIADEGRVGNLVFLTEPDEEVYSAGMRAAARFLPRLFAEWGLRPAGALNLDSHGDTGDGAEGRSVFMGSVGKVLPFALFLGRLTHASEAFEGFPATLAAARFALLAECAATEAGVPPLAMLYYRDLRKGYDVSTPASILCALNALSTSRGSRETLDSVARFADEALREGIADFARKAAEAGLPAAVPQAGRVLLFDELLSLARAAGAEAADRAVDAARASGEDPAVACGEAAAALAAIAGVEGPAAVVGIAPPFYPVAELDGSPEHALFAERISETAALVARRLGQSLTLRPFFMGISDMSFLNPACGAADEAYAASQSPLAPVPGADGEGEGQALRLPIANVGPWGRDAHKRLERVYAPYAFGELPGIISEFARALLR